MAMMVMLLMMVMVMLLMMVMVMMMICASLFRLFASVLRQVRTD